MCIRDSLLVARIDRIGNLQPLPMFHDIQASDRARFVLDPGDAQVVGLHDLAQLGAHEFDDALEVQAAGDALLLSLIHI